jgi:hypothetical protein
MNDDIISRLREVPGGVAEDAIVEITNLKAKNARLLGALLRWIAAEDEGDGHECIHALADARKLLGETQ